MADTVQINSRGKQAKIRNPWLVVLFSFITLGIYYLCWYYFVNREMSDWGQEHETDIGLSPGVSVIAITIGWFIIVPPFVSIFHTGKRMQLSQRVADVHGGSGLLFFFLWIIPFVSIFSPAYLQTELNKVWETQRAALAPAATEAPELPVAPETPMAGEIPVAPEDAVIPETPPEAPTDN